MTIEKGSSSGEKADLFAPDIPDDISDIFKKDRNKWSKDDYIKAFRGLSDGQLRFKVQFQREMLVSPAFLGLSPRGTKLLVCCWNVTDLVPEGKKNRPIGKHEINSKGIMAHEIEWNPKPFFCPYNLAEAFGVGTPKQITKAFQELKALGFIEQIGISRRNYPNVYKRSEGWRRLSFEDVQRIQTELKKGVK